MLTPEEYESALNALNDSDLEALGLTRLDVLESDNVFRAQAKILMAMARHAGMMMREIKERGAGAIHMGFELRCIDFIGAFEEGSGRGNSMKQ